MGDSSPPVSAAMGSGRPDPQTPDYLLLERYVRQRDEQAFAELVRGHVNLVHAAARRQSPQAAEDITQAVFLLLAQRAARVPRHRPLAGWLCQATRYCCANHNKREARLRLREQRAAAMNPRAIADGNGEQMLAVLDEGLASLSGGERDAVVLHFLENRTLAETAAELDLGRNTVGTRVSRGLEKLRRFFARRGYIVPAAAVTGLLAAESVKAAPATLAAKVAVVGVHGAVVSAQTAAIAKGASAMMTWIKVKLAAAVIGAALITGGAGAVVIQQSLATPIQPSPVPPTPPAVAQRVLPAPQPPVPVTIAQAPSPRSATSIATAPATMPAVADLSPEQRRVYEIIYDLRQAIPPQRPNEWIANLRELESIGRPAVPALVVELDRAKRDGEQRLLIMALRYIHDPRAVPALIRAMPRVAQVSSDYGFPVPDPELKKFLDDHYWNPPVPAQPEGYCFFNRGITECIAALETIANYSFGHELIANGPNDTPEELARDMEERMVFVRVWQQWWDTHGSGLVIRQDLESLQAAQFDGDLVQAVGAARDGYGSSFPTGRQVRLSPVHEVTIQSQIPWDAKAYIDFDSGRVLEQYEGLEFPKDQPGAETTWLHNAGVDAIAMKVRFVAEQRGGEFVTFCRLDGADLKAWQIPNGRFEMIEAEVGNAGQELDLDAWGWGPTGSLLPRDLKSGANRTGTYPATFLFITREGGHGILQIVASVDDGNAVKIRYRMFEGLPVQRPPLADRLVPATSPAAPRMEFAPVHEVKLALPTAAAENSALALKTGMTRPQTVDVDNPAFNDAKHAWLREWSGDVLTMVNTGKALYGLGSDQMLTMEVSAAAWEQFRADDIPVFVARRDPSRINRGVHDFIQPDRDRKPPTTWIFKTRSGDMGMLQITAVGQDSLTLRYKLVREKKK